MRIKGTHAARRAGQPVALHRGAVEVMPPAILERPAEFGAFPEQELFFDPEWNLCEKQES